MNRFTAVCLLAGSSLLAARQTPPAPQQPPVFRSTLDLMTLDVSVLDKNRQPVHGLTKEDFTLLEDGKPQTIEAFSSVDLPDPPVPTAPWMREVGPDVTTNDMSSRRVFIIALQEGGDLWAQREAKASALGFIDRMGPDDLGAVVFLGVTTKARAQNLTADHDKLKAAVKTYNSMASHYLRCGIINTLMNITETLRDAGMPDRRKAVVYFGVDVRAEVGCPYTMGDLFRAAQQGNVNFYPINVMGLGLGGGGGMLALADNTGGHAVVNTNDFEPGIKQIFVENQSYYLLGYRPTNVKEDGTFRRLEVKVNRPDVEVRSREQYIAPKAPPPPGSKKAVPSPAADFQALANILPKSDVPMRVALAPFAVPGRSETAIAVALGVEVPPVSTRTTEQADLLVWPFTSDGLDRGKSNRSMTLTLPAARRGADASRYDLISRVDLKPGKYELRLSAHSAILDKQGSVYGDIDVPDFAKAALSMSGVVMSVTPGVPVEPAEALRELIPVIPSTARDFQRFERVSGFFRVYQGGKIAPVTLTTRIVDAGNKAVVEETKTLAADQFRSKATDITFPVPVAQLAPGDYLLSFEVTNGKDTARRDVRFRVR